MSKKRALSPLSKTRNSFHPFFNAAKKRPFWKQMQTVRQETSPVDYAAVCAVVEANAAYPFPGLGTTFPADHKRVPDSRFLHLKPLAKKQELRLQVARINHHASRIRDALQSVAAINQHLTKREHERAKVALATHRAEYGLSFITIKKELLLALDARGLAGLSSRYRELTSDSHHTAWALLCHYVYDLLDPTYEPGRAVRSWSALVAKANR